MNVNTKQFTILFILVTVFLFAMSTVAALAQRESTTTYDTSSLKYGLVAIAHQAAYKIAHQEASMQGWVDEATNEVWDAYAKNHIVCDHTENLILNYP